MSMAFGLKFKTFILLPVMGLNLFNLLDYVHVSFG